MMKFVKFLKELLVHNRLVLSFNGCKICIDQQGNLFVYPKNYYRCTREFDLRNVSPEMASRIISYADRGELEKADALVQQKVQEELDRQKKEAYGRETVR
ncbi:MAG: hypothetical protein ABEK59_11420 [Halobacteria archaeon]